MKKLLNIREPNVYARHLEAEVVHPLISVVHFDELEKGVRTSLNSYNVYGLFIQREFPQNLSYGVRPVQVSEWSVIAVAPGQIGGKEVGIGDAQVERGHATHGLAGCINPVRVNGVGLRQ